MQICNCPIAGLYAEKTRQLSEERARADRLEQELQYMRKIWGENRTPKAAAVPPITPNSKICAICGKEITGTLPEAKGGNGDDER